MDALPIKEETGLDFASNNEYMHACGHDMHTAMMLGAAKILKKYEDEINGTVKLMFQSAEEIFEGSHDMIENGILENPTVDAALMIHVMANTPFEAGTVIVSSPGVSAPAADYFEIKIQGSGCPTLVNDKELSKCVAKYTEELLGKEKAFTVEELNSMAGRTDI